MCRPNSRNDAYSSRRRALDDKENKCGWAGCDGTGFWGVYVYVYVYVTHGPLYISPPLFVIQCANGVCHTVWMASKGDAHSSTSGPSVADCNDAMMQWKGLDQEWVQEAFVCHPSTAVLFARWMREWGGVSRGVYL